MTCVTKKHAALVDAPLKEYTAPKDILGEHGGPDHMAQVLPQVPCCVPSRSPTEYIPLYVIPWRLYVLFFLYVSQCNPIERHLCSHVTRACQGGLFDSLHTVRGLIQKTKTPQGLSVTLHVLDTLYEGGRTVTEAFKKNMPIVFGHQENSA